MTSKNITVVSLKQYNIEENNDNKYINIVLIITSPYCMK